MTWSVVPIWVFLALGGAAPDPMPGGVAGPATGSTGPTGSTGTHGREPLHGVYRLDNGLVLPYPLDNLMRGWTECASRRGGHHALDIGGVGPDYGVGTPLRAMARAKVMAFETTSSNPERCGAPLKDATTTVRSGQTLPTSRDIEGYGRVWFFSKDYGRHRSGGYLTLKLLEGPYEDHTVRYLHIAAVRPGLKVGDEVDAGDEVALLGGTAVMDAGPHVHLAIETPEGRELDVGKILGIGSTYVGCKASADTTRAVRGAYSAAAKKLMARLRADAAAERESAPAAACGTWTIEGDFEDGAVKKVKVPLPDGRAAIGVPWSVTLERHDPRGECLDKPPRGHRNPLHCGWQPRLQVTDRKGRAWFTGTQATRAAKKKVAFVSRSSGKKGRAEVELVPAVEVPMMLEVMPWPIGKKALRGAAWRLTISRPCRDGG